MTDDQAERIVKIFADAGMTIELGAQFSVKGQIAQLLNGCEKLIEQFKTDEYNAEFPDVFISGNIGERCDLDLCRDALMAWSVVMFGNKPTDQFGKTMASIAGKLGVLGTAESFSQWLQEHGLTTPDGRINQPAVARYWKTIRVMSIDQNKNKDHGGGSALNDNDVFQRLTDAGHNATSAFHDSTDKARTLILELRKLSNTPGIDTVIKPKSTKPFYRHNERW